MLHSTPETPIPKGCYLKAICGNYEYAILFRSSVQRIIYDNSNKIFWSVLCKIRAQVEVHRFTKMFVVFLLSNILLIIVFQQKTQHKISL